MEECLGGVTLGALPALLVVLVNVIFLRSCVQHVVTLRLPGCSLPNCARCRQQRQRKEELIERLSRFLRDVNSGGDPLDERRAWRLWELVDSVDKRHLILRDIYCASGYGIPSMEETSEVPHDEPVAISSPVIWVLPELKQAALWHRHDHPDLHSVFVTLEEVTLLSALRTEYHRIMNHDEHWLVNQTPAGKWRVFHLYNQGRKIDTNCQLCPVATKTVETLQGFMKGNLFCYAVFSVLEPGSVIEPHTGPCNYRLRCHLPLYTPAGFFLQVGSTTVEWKAGRVIVFDDSLMHRVWHSVPPGEKEAGRHGDSQLARVVLIVDVWHPGVEELERHALNSMFPPTSEAANYREYT